MRPVHVLERPPRVGTRLAYGPEEMQFLDWYGAPARGAPMVAAIHGGYWRGAYGLEHLSHLCAALAASGIATASLEYRRVGQPGGGWPTSFEDIQRALDALPRLATSLGADASRLVLLGHSAGGQLALWAASHGRGGEALLRPSRVQPRGILALAPLGDLAEASRLNLSEGAVRAFLGGTPEQFPERYRDASPAELLPLGVRTTLLHGTNDADVPYALSPAYVARASAAGEDARLVTLEGADHFDLIDPESHVWPQVLKAVQELLERADA